MSDLPPNLPTTPAARPQLLDGRTWKGILGPLAFLALTAICGSVTNLNGLAMPLMIATAIAMLVASIRTAWTIGGKRGASSASRFGWGVLAFVILLIFYI